METNEFKDAVIGIPKIKNGSRIRIGRVRTLNIDVDHHFKSFIEIGVGDVSASVVDKRGIAQKVLMFNATAFVLVHNHPSGDPTPSVIDISTAKTLSELGYLIGVTFKDMIILGDGNYISLKQEGYF